VDDLSGDLFQIATKRTSTSEQFIEDHAERVDITAPVCAKRLTTRLLWSHVRGCAQEPQLPQFVVPCRVLQGTHEFLVPLDGIRNGVLRNPKIENMGLTVAGNNDVGRFQVSMHDSFIVGEMKRAGQALNDPGGFLRTALPQFQPIFERDATYEITDDKYAIPQFANLACLGNTRVMEAHRCSQFCEDRRLRLGSRFP
jgi:hypothetical protein